MYASSSNAFTLECGNNTYYTNIKLWYTTFILSIQVNEITKFASQMCYGPIALSNMICQHECVMYHRTLVASTLIILLNFSKKKILKEFFFVNYFIWTWNFQDLLIIG
jgi:hypothetical protein